MTTINTVLVRGQKGSFEVYPYAPDLPITSDPDTILEAVRVYIWNRWSAKVHALRWIVPDDLLLDMPNKDPWLVLHIDEPGVMVRNRRELSFTNVPGPVVSEAARLCCYQPWSAAEWFAAMFRRLQGVLGRKAAFRLHQVRVTANGAVLKCVAGKLTCYVKTVPPFFSYEPRLLSFLHNSIPGICPRVLHGLLDTNSHVTVSLFGRPLHESSRIHDWKNALGNLGNFQVRTLRHTDAICQLGVPYPGLNLIYDLGAVLRDLVSIQRGAVNELNEEELNRIPAWLSSASRDCEILANSKLPAALVHGDCSEHNLILLNNKYSRLIDWSFSWISHPFFILNHTLFNAFEDPGHRMRDAVRELAVAYLEAWRSFAPESTLLASLRAAARLRWIDMAHNLTPYIQHLRNVEPGNVAQIPMLLRHALATSNSENSPRAADG